MLFANCAVIFVMTVLMNAVSIIWIIAEDAQKSAAHAQKNAQELSAPGAVSLKELTRKAAREVEREAILKVLEANQWNRKRAACVLNISYRALLYKLKDTGMVPAPSSSNRMEARRGVNTAAI